MIAKQLKTIYDPYINLDIKVWENFEKLGFIENLTKETTIKEANTTEKYLNIILKGSGGNLLWKKNNFVCIDIALKNDGLFDFMSFSLQKPTPIEVKIFEDTTLFRISHQNFQQTMKAGNFGEKITRLVAEYAFIDKQQQQIDLLTKTAKERYIKFIQSKREIDKIPLKYLASYLGITPQSLSRIRSEKI